MPNHDAKSTLATLVRAFALSLTAAAAMFSGIVVFATWNQPGCIFGWNLGTDGTTLISVTPGRPAWNAGIRAGDRVDWPTLPLLGRANLALVQTVYPGAHLTLTIRRGDASRRVTLEPVPWEGIIQEALRAITLGGLIVVAIGIALVAIRPCRMTWGFLFSGFGWSIPVYLALLGQRGPVQFLFANGLMSVLYGFSTAGLLMFMTRFPSDRVRGPLGILDRFAVPLGALVAALGLYLDVTLLRSPNAPPAWTLLANQYIVNISIAVIAIAALASTFAVTKGSDRQRVIPVLLCFAAYVATAMGTNIYNALFTVTLGTASLFLLMTALTVLLAFAVANGVIRHRVIDVSFAVSRTLVYTILTSIIVGVFALIDFISSKMLEHLQFALMLETAAALVFGFSLNALHARVDRIVDKVFFRRRHEAQERLERAANVLMHSETAEFVDEALVSEPCEALDLATAAVFRLTGPDRFERTASVGWEPGQAQLLTGSDRIVVHLRAELQALDLSGIRRPRVEVPMGIGQPLLAIPFVVRHELLGFVAYGGHRGGEALDPDEIRELRRLADSAASAYDHIEAQALRLQVRQAETEIARLRHDEDLVDRMIAAVRTAPRSV